MEIKIEIFGRTFSLCIGRKTNWFAQVNFITLVEEFSNNREIVFANLILKLF